MRRRGRPKDNVYWGAFILKWFELLQTSNFTGTDYKILFFLCSKMDPRTNNIYIKQIQIAQELHLDKGNVSKAIKKLRDEQFIAKIQNGFMLNPNLFYVGKARREDREDVREQFDSLVEHPRFFMDEDEGQLIDITDSPNTSRVRNIKDLKDMTDF
ncbi:MarR family transcriptional regulator [Cytobacillus gottheilii]|uniref:MarR family transcriptional regulator n=1 Tax=Cytobacillus gottheilii TaxID=859144 RepID=UPI003CF8810B